MDSVVSFPVVGRYREDAEMGYYVEDEEHDALELCPLEAFPLYANLRKRMDFATGIVGGRKRRISWGEIAQWMHRDSARGRKAVTISVSKARRLVAQMEKHGLLENRTDREEDRLIFFLPLAKSDLTEARKLQKPEYRREREQAIAETENCISIHKFRKREATTGQFVAESPNMLMDSTELPLPSDTVHTYSSEAQNRAESRQTFGSPAVANADRVEGVVSDYKTCDSWPEAADSRQASDGDPEPKADNNNPFTPLRSNNIDINTIQRAGAREGVRKGSSPKLNQVIQAAIEKQSGDRKPAALPVHKRLTPGLETLVYDEGSGFTMQISPGLRRKNPDLAKRLEGFVAETFGGEGKA